ncbi:MAG: 4Fe-4S dicluster domain-containing protein [Actinomycetia bacterium]|nr:4Fe-4S dicluster domain-containing protein [Actinomycetes bacterium]
MTVLSKDKVNNKDVKKIKDITGENPLACYQCGSCSSGCPGAEYMDMQPQEVIRYIQLGMVDEILETNTAWICLSCVTCAVRCPKGVDLAKLMEGVREIYLRKNGNDNKVDLDKIKAEKLKDLPQIALVGGLRKFTG